MVCEIKSEWTALYYRGAIEHYSYESTVRFCMNIIFSLDVNRKRSKYTFFIFILFVTATYHVKTYIKVLTSIDNIFVMIENTVRSTEAAVL